MMKVFWLPFHDEAHCVTHCITALICAPSILPHLGEWLTLAATDIQIDLTIKAEIFVATVSTASGAVLCYDSLARRFRSPLCMCCARRFPCMLVLAVEKSPQPGV